MTIRQKVSLACGLITLLVVAIGGGLVAASIWQLNIIEAGTKSLKVAEANENFGEAIGTAQTRLLKLMVSGQFEAIADFPDDVDRIYAAARDLREMLDETDNSSKIIQTLNNIEEELSVWVDSVARPQIQDMNDPYTVDMARVRQALPETEALIRSIDEGLEQISATARAANAADLDKLHTSQEFMRTAAIVVSAILVAACLAIVLFFQRAVVGPLRLLTGTTDRLRQRDWTVQIPRAEAKDEIGQLARALEVLRDEGKHNDEAELTRAEATKRQIARAEEIRAAAADFQRQARAVLGELESAGGTLSETASSLTEMAGSSYAYTQNVSASAQSTGSSVQSVAASIEEMSISVNEISRQMQSASTLAQKTTTASETAAAQVNGLLKKSERIHDVIGLINGIASQINLLALNATIESARAGDAGKGFAVVAQQVKELADQTANATEEITKVINEVSTEISGVVTAIEGIGVSIKAVNDNSSAVAAAVEEQSAAISEISSNVGHVSTQTSSVAENVKGVESKVGETRKLASSVGELSQRLKSTSTKMGTEIDSFLEAVIKEPTADTA